MLGEDPFTAAGSTSTAAASVAVIGGGPGAMFLCHALEIQRKELIEKGKDVGSFPLIRCFERSAGPGGVWRSDRTHEEDQDALHIDRTRTMTPEDHAEEKKEVGEDHFGRWERKQVEATLNSGDNKDPSKQKTTNMYSGLWINGSKELIEFFDYTFKDHFGDIRMPSHLPRKYILEYMLARVTTNCPDFFERYFFFRTTVVHVEQTQQDANGKKKFRVCTRNETTGTKEVSYFDKCIWAAGVNGIPRTPQNLVRIFEEGGFQGRIVHSSDTSNFKQDIEGKHVLLVGGGYSAEDLALMAIKEGVSKVYCTCRSEDNCVMETTRWPYDKLTVYDETSIEKVSGSTVTLVGTCWDLKQQKYGIDTDQSKRKVLKNIDTIIFCTGYEPNMTMLEKTLQKEPFQITRITVPEDWTMEPSEFNSRVLGEEYAQQIRPENNQVLACNENRAGYTKLYKGIFLIDNPGMMYMLEYSGVEVPILEFDITAWAIVKVLTNQVTLPSVEEMEADNVRVHLECMHDPFFREEIDWKYAEAIMEENSMERKDYEKLCEKQYLETTMPSFYRILGQFMNEFGYPVSFVEKDAKTFSNYYDIFSTNSVYDCTSRKLARFKYDEENTSTSDTDDDGESTSTSDDDDDDGENTSTSDGDDAPNTSVTRPGWRTFRDDPALENCTSYFTGIKAISLPKPWVELNEEDPLW